MLLSMTGHGQAMILDDRGSVMAEIRTVNNRYLKVNLSGSDLLSALEVGIENLVRGRVRRGTVNLRIHVQRPDAAQPYRLNLGQLRSYAAQLKQEGLSSDAAALLTLPGVVEESLADADSLEALRPWVERAVIDALDHLDQMRRREGAAMAADLEGNCDRILEHLEAVAQRAPAVTAAYGQRLAERISQWLREYDLAVQPGDFVREVGLFAERCDVSEEIVRLRSHIEQFRLGLRAEESSGRKLEFLTQELLREANTIGSKANDAEIAVRVVEIKSIIERIREMVQNVE